MASDRRHLAGTLAHLAAIAAAWAGVTWAWARPDSGTLLLLSGLLVAGLIVSLLRFQVRHDRDLTRFVEAIGHGDLSQRFGPGPVAEALDRATARLRDERQVAGEDARFQRALVEKTPVPLITVDRESRVRLLRSEEHTSELQSH